MDRECWRYMLELVQAVDPGQDRRLAAMAHLGAAALLFEDVDPDMAAAILEAAEGAARARQGVGD